MRVTAYLADRGTIAIANMSDASALELRDDLAAGATWVQLDLDGDVVLINAAQIVRWDFATSEQRRRARASRRRRNRSNDGT